MIGGGDEILSQTGRVGAKSPIFDLFSPVIASNRKADGRRSKFLVRETRTRNLVQEICIQVASKFLVRETWPMIETIKNFKFYFFSDSNL